MPKKSSVVASVPAQVSTPEPAAKDAPRCGHINKQFYNTDGQLEDLACDLPAGHAPVLVRTEQVKDETGNVIDVPVFERIHSAEYEFKKASIIPSLKRRVEGAQITYEVVKARGEWTDKAGTPA